eukprot:gnl/MRDRNA2_/MRDRNA2_105906_c0_seq1.p1 gnl/MRDRNA2_/MRDRNA2_105906_c0~~gnl/MRDRNA2_/MRDRNA2_105906_c0_seq1.p1  ORF type:complete len:323 (+),score=45.41 gnl/MRDRNA2_/MRDRNA2_105906_c0_seq1:131-1099(+)
MGFDFGWIRDIDWQHLGSVIAHELLIVVSFLADTTRVIKTAFVLFITVTVATWVYKNPDRVMYFFFGTKECKCSWPDAVMWFLSCCGCCHNNCCVKACGRCLGVEYLVIQMDEIRLGHLPFGGDLYLNVSAGTNPEFCTGCILRSSGEFCEFEEVFNLNLRHYDGDVVIKVMDQDMLSHDEIGRVEMDASDFIRLARRNKTNQIYRFDLKLPGKSAAEKKTRSGKRGVQPFIALRIVDVTGETEQTLGRTGMEESRRLISTPGLTHYKIDPSDNQIDFDNPEVMNASGVAAPEQQSMFSSMWKTRPPQQRSNSSSSRLDRYH